VAGLDGFWEKIMEISPGCTEGNCADKKLLVKTTEYENAVLQFSKPLRSF
jgi:hypothetical protein